jgi:cell division protein FtsB
VTLLQKRQILEEQRQELVRLQEENRKLEEALSQADTPEFVEKEAREKLGLVKEGETIVILPKTDPSSLITDQQESNWKQWWGLFF